MLPINDYAMFQRRQEELLKQAEIELLVRTAEDARPGAAKFPRKCASWLGIHLVRWGQKLEQFGTSEKRQHPASASARA
ncbi:MAG TPA: hypothetical protein VKR83_13670 [Ktedonobacteraceae bacterium]|nr:hypothetical protein [Ktedonobacteraceae bacterium]